MNNTTTLVLRKLKFGAMIVSYETIAGASSSCILVYIKSLQMFIYTNTQ